MKQYKYKNRDEYLDKQIARSQAKAEYCKVFFSDIFRYWDLLEEDLAKRSEGKAATALGPILCLGVRSGAEVDMFRSVFFSRSMRLQFLRDRVIAIDNGKLGVSKMRIARRYGWGMGQPTDGRVLGVELNPDIERPDVWVGSFDQLPENWTNSFKLLYSNSFDHSQDPADTVAEWKRVAAPGAYVIIAFVAGANPTPTDPLGEISIQRLKDLWQAELIFASKDENQNGYHEVCFRV